MCGVSGDGRRPRQPSAPAHCARPAPKAAFLEPVAYSLQSLFLPISSFSSLLFVQTHLHQVRVPGIAADVEVVVAELFASRLAKNVACWEERKPKMSVNAKQNVEIKTRICLTALTQGREARRGEAVGEAGDGDGSSSPASCPLRLQR